MLHPHQGERHLSLGGIFDMGQVVLSVPGIKGQDGSQGVVFISGRVVVLSFPLMGVEGFDQSSPSVVDPLKDH